MKAMLRKEVVEFSCDKCKKRMDRGIPYEVIGGYGNTHFDGEVLHFCSDLCFARYFSGIALAAYKKAIADGEEQEKWIRENAKELVGK